MHEESTTLEVVERWRQANEALIRRDFDRLMRFFAPQAVWDAADWPTRDAMDLAYLTGQRPADVLKMRLPDIRDGFLWLTQGKTRKKLRMLS